MALKVNPKWTNKMREQIAARKAERNGAMTLDTPFESVTCSLNAAAQWLIVALDNAGIPFTVKSLGGGVKKIFYNEYVCPCCHKKIKPEGD